MGLLVALERVTVVHGVAVVLDALTLGVDGGARVGVVGRNGSGKSTLLRVLAGQQDVDSGRVTRPAAFSSVGLLPQSDVLDPGHSVRTVVVGDRPAHEWAGDARIRQVLTGLLGGEQTPLVGGLDTRVGALSGGQRRRVALAALLVAAPHLLLLDEPTNHLEIEGVAWLAGHLSSWWNRPDCALVAVTHDRWFLDAVASRTWEVHAGSVSTVDGGYAAYVLARAERERTQRQAEQRRASLARKELAWLRRGPPARTSKPRFRVEAATALVADEPPARDEVELLRFAKRRLGREVVDLLDATVVRGGRAVLDQVTWRLAPGERVGLVGGNGSGKSTLLQALAGELPMAAGRRRVGRTVALAHLTQEAGDLDQLADYSVIEAIEQERRLVTLGKAEVTASWLATRLGFPPRRQRTRVGDLSGGERRRLQLLRLLLCEPNVLLLDEPTNDLDLETLTSLEDVLDGWAGTLVAASHDRYLLERVTDRQVALLGDGRIRDLPGGIDQYLQLLRDKTPQSTTPEVMSAAGASSGPSEAATARQARKTLARVEKALSRLADREEHLHARLAAVASDHEAVRALDAQLRALAAEREDLELEWFEAAEALE